MKNKIDKIQHEIISLLDDVNDRLYKKSYIDYIIMISGGDFVPELSSIGKEPYVVDYHVDSYYDQTRERFYIDYLNKRYANGDFDYSEHNGFFDLNIELMIYSHIWESHYFLKLLTHMADLLTGKPYDWALRIPSKDIKSHIKKRIINPLIQAKDELGFFLKDAYSPNLRNGFAHSMYNVDCDRNIISLHNLTFDTEDSINKEISFEDFQLKFLRSIHLSYLLTLNIEKQRITAAIQHSGKALTEAFYMPNHRKLQIFVEYRPFLGKGYPSFRASWINETVNKYKVGDYVRLGSITTPIEVVDVYDLGKDQAVRLKGAVKWCSSKLLDLSEKPEFIDDTCSDYQLIKQYLL